MIDMLVNLYTLADPSSIFMELGQSDISLRRARTYERDTVLKWVGDHFSPKWVSETKVAFSRRPVSCFIATREGRILGFACYEVTARGFYGPTGVAESARGMGIGKGLLYKSMYALKELGYVYGVIGGVGPKEFYEKICGAIEIPGSNPGIYTDILPDPE